MMKEEICAEEIEFPVKDKARGIRRKKNVAKARRKSHIATAIYGHSLYGNLHEYSKNKIHCSCQLCRFRNVFNPDNRPMSDVRKIDSLDFKIAEWLLDDVG